MRAEIKHGLLIVIPQDDAERAAFGLWRTAHNNHVFHLIDGNDRGGALHDMGRRPEACREPINIAFAVVEPRWKVISNLAPTPFVLRDRRYASVEGFWQGLKFSDESERAAIGALSGPEAVRAAAGAAVSTSFVFEGKHYAVGAPGHHALMREACWAKFTQHGDAREALLATGDRPLIHRMRKDSVNIPGALMADIWMRIRTRLRRLA